MDLLAIQQEFAQLQQHQIKLATILHKLVLATTVARWAISEGIAQRLSMQIQPLDKLMAEQKMLLSYAFVSSIFLYCETICFVHK